MDKLWCVYIHISPSNKYYVGITCQRPQDRWRNGKGYNHNSYFTKAINKYGWDSFQHEIIASNLTEEEAKNFEKLLIKKLKSNNKEYGYNFTEGGDGVCGVSPSKEHRERLREMRGFSVCQFDMDMNLISEYRSVREASEKTGISMSTILNCCYTKFGYKTTGGFIWIFKNDLQNIDLSVYKQKVLYEKSLHAIIQYTLSMDFVAEYENISHATRMTGIQFSDISRALSGKLKQAGGYIWIYKTQLYELSLEELKSQKKYENLRCKIVYQFSLDMQFIQEFKSGTDASKSVGTTPQAILYACKSKTHKSCGYLWWFKDDYEKEVVT